MGGSTKNTGSTSSYTSMPGMQDVLGSAKTIFNSGAPWKPNTTSMVTPFATQTKVGLQGMNSAAKDSLGAMYQNFDRVNSTLQDGGLNSLQQQQVDRLNPIANGDRMNGNPYLDDLIKRSGDDMRYQQGAIASGMGRYGSGGHEGVLAKSIGDMSGNLRYQNYGDEANRQMDAIGSLYNAGTQQRQNVLGGTQQLTDAYNAKLSPYQTMMGVGGAYENKNNQVLQDRDRIFRETQNAQTSPIDWLNGLAHGYQGGQQVTNQQQPYSPIGQGIGAGLGTYGMTGNPLLSLLGGLGGAFS